MQIGAGIGHVGPNTEQTKGFSGMALMKSALAAIASMWIGTACAQGPMPEDIAWKLLEIGRVIDVPKTAALYAPLQQKEPYAGVKTERDVKYGPADRNRRHACARQPHRRCS